MMVKRSNQEKNELTASKVPLNIISNGGLYKSSNVCFLLIVA